MTATRRKVPSQGDVVWLTMDPTAGREQQGHRPHLVLSDQRLAEATGLVIGVPLTSKQRPWATRVEVAPGSYAIGEQVRTFSLERITRIDAAGHDTTRVVEVIDRLIAPR